MFEELKGRVSVMEIYYETYKKYDEERDKEITVLYDEGGQTYVKMLEISARNARRIDMKTPEYEERIKKIIRLWKTGIMTGEDIDFSLQLPALGMDAQTIINAYEENDSKTFWKNVRRGYYDK